MIPRWLRWIGFGITVIPYFCFCCVRYCISGKLPKFRGEKR